MTAISFEIRLCKKMHPIRLEILIVLTCFFPLIGHWNKKCFVNIKTNVRSFRTEYHGFGLQFESKYFSFSGLNKFIMCSLR